LYKKPIISTVFPEQFNMGDTIINISLDDMLRIIVIGTTKTIYVHSYENSLLYINSPLYTLTNNWAINYRLYFDPIFYRVIIDFDISTDEA
jgi:hypothetical protein